jgi:hypothetical protein
MTNKSILTITLTALALLPTACTINSTTNNGGTGGTTNAGGSVSTGGSTSTAGSTATGGTTSAGGTSSAAGSTAAAGASNVAGSANLSGSANLAGSAGTAGSAGAAGAVDVAGSAGTAGTTSSAGTAGTAGVTSSSCPVASTRVDVADDIAAAAIWTADHVYVIPAGDTRYVSAALTIQPCTVVKFGAGSSLYIEATGQLNAIGSASAHIVFTSLKDDSAGGDTDGSVLTPTAGDWSTVIVAANSSGFDYVEFRYSDEGIALSGANQSVRHSTFTSNNFALDATSVRTTCFTAIRIPSASRVAQPLILRTCSTTRRRRLS